MNAFKNILNNRIRKPMDGKLRVRLSVFFICMLIAVALWGMIKLTKEYQVPLKFSINLTELPDDRVLVSNPDSIITLTLKAKGLDLYSRMLNQKKNTITLSLRNMRLIRSGNLYSGYLRTSRLNGVISGQLPGGVELVGIEPDTLRFEFERSVRKKVAVIPDVKLDFARQYQLYDSIRIEPDSIYITGRKEILDTIAFLRTKYTAFQNLRENITGYLILKTPAVWPPVQLARDSVKMELVVEKFTEATIEVLVSMKAGERSQAYRTFPEKVTLTCRVAMRDYNRVDPGLFVASIDPAASDVSGNNRLPVEIIRAPSFAKVIRIEPEKVEYLLLQ